MNHVDDDRVAFYLRHQELIETWHSVRRDATEAAHLFYLSLAADLEEIAAEIGPDVGVWVRDGTWSDVGLYRRAWNGDDAPLMAVTYEWHSKSTFVDGIRFVGLRTHNEVEKGKSLRPFVGDEVRNIRVTAGFAKSSATWPAYRDAATPETESYWDDLTSYRSVLRAGVEEAWTALAEPADRAFASWKKASE
jgi:hypothetical protein